MAMTLLQSLSAMVTAAIALVGIGLIGWLVYKRALLDAQSKAMEIQAQALEAYELRIKQLEDKVNEQGGIISEQGRQISHLEGVIKGKDDALRAVIEAIADTDRCLTAHSCPNRSVPTV